MLEDVPNTHDSKRHQRASLRQARVAETVVEPWLLGWRWDVICSDSKRSCSAGCRPVARPGARCWDGGANRWLDSLCRGSGAPVFPRDLDLIRVADPRPAAVVVDCWLDTVPPDLLVRDPQRPAGRCTRGRLSPPSPTPRCCCPATPTESPQPAPATSAARPASFARRTA